MVSGPVYSVWRRVVLLGLGPFCVGAIGSLSGVVGLLCLVSWAKWSYEDFVFGSCWFLELVCLWRLPLELLFGMCWLVVWWLNRFVLACGVLWCWVIVGAS